MKSLIAITVATFLFFSGNTMANSSSGGAKAPSATGPWVECLLPDGKVDYTPLMICKMLEKR